MRLGERGLPVNQILLKDAIDGWLTKLGKPIQKFSCGCLKKLAVAPGRIVMIGAPPGVGKTALTMQLTFDALHANPDLKAVVCNVEMSPDALLERELARVSGVPLDDVHLSEKREQIENGIQTIRQIENRLAFV